MSTLYEDDVTAWATQQAALLRRGQWSQLDIDNIAEEIEDMNISHRHQLAHRIVDIAGRETNVTDLPKVRAWDFEQVLSKDYFPS